jgi:hypothetical protein
MRLRRSKNAGRQPQANTAPGQPGYAGRIGRREVNIPKTLRMGLPVVHMPYPKQSACLPQPSLPQGPRPSEMRHGVAFDLRLASATRDRLAAYRQERAPAATKAIIAHARTHSNLRPSRLPRQAADAATNKRVEKDRLDPYSRLAVFYRWKNSPPPIVQKGRGAINRRPSEGWTGQAASIRLTAVAA